MSVEDDRYTLRVTPTARRQLAEVLPEAVAMAAHEFIVGPLLSNPHRMGKRLRPPLEDRHSARRGTYRVIYRIDDEQQTSSTSRTAATPIAGGRSAPGGATRDPAPLAADRTVGAGPGLGGGGPRRAVMLLKPPSLRDTPGAPRSDCASG